MSKTRKKSFMQKAYEKLMILLNNSTSLRIIPCVEHINENIRIRRLVLCYHNGDSFTPLMFILNKETLDAVEPVLGYEDQIWDLIEEAKGIDHRTTMEEFDNSIDEINDLFWNSTIVEEVDEELKKVIVS